MLRKFENFGGMDYLVNTTKEIMYDLPEGYTYNVYQDGEMLGVEVMTDEPIHHAGEDTVHLQESMESVVEAITRVTRIAGEDGLKPYIFLITHVNERGIWERSIYVKPEDDPEEKIQYILEGTSALIAIRTALEIPKRIATSQDLPKGPEAVQVQRVLNVLKTLYPIRIKDMDPGFSSKPRKIKSMYLYAHEKSIILNLGSMGETRGKLKRDLEDIEVENLDVSDASINKAIKLYLAPHASDSFYID
jgi:hypothetical protein